MGLGLGQHDPTEVTAARDTGQQRRADTASLSRQPNEEQDRIRYGVITEVNENGFVKVRLLTDDGIANGDEIVSGAFLPLMTPLSQIFLLWGNLRKGLLCRVFWRGKLEPNASTVIEIIADEEHNFLKKEPQSNEIDTGPWKLFSGGLIG